MKKTIKKRLSNLKNLAGRALLRIFHLAPVRLNSVVAFSYNGSQFGCNPRSIYLTAVKTNPELQWIWIFKKPERFAWLKEADTQIAQWGSIPSFWHVARSEALVMNSNPPSWFVARKNQVVVHTSHGGGAYKKLMFDNPMRSESAKRRLLTRSSQITHFISPCEDYSTQVVRGAFRSKAEAWPIGSPRLDFLFHEDARHDQERKHIRESLELPADEKLFVYAPTYRKTGCGSYSSFPTRAVRNALEERFGGQWTMLYRGHRWLTGLGLQAASFDKNISGYSDYESLIGGIDFFVTDYSSLVWDYAVSETDGLLFAPDLVEYQKCQGTYTEISKWPYKLTLDSEELVSSILSYDLDGELNRRRQHLLNLGSFENGSASLSAVQLLSTTIENHRA